MKIDIFARQPLFLRKTAVALVVCMVLMWIDSKSPAWFQNMRSFTHASMQPIYQLSLIPNFGIHWGTGTFRSKESLRRENIQLKAQLLHAQAKLQQQDYVLAQNARLQGILSTTKPDQFSLLLSQVVGTDTNPTKQIVVLNKGKNHGVRVGQTAIDENGVMGQIINVYPDTSRLLLITDEQQSVAVNIKRTGQKAIVTGKGSPTQLSLDYIFKTADVRVGDELISSGLGGRIPAGYRVGRIEYIDPKQTDNFITINVKPAANFINNGFVLLLQDKDMKSQDTQFANNNEQKNNQPKDKQKNNEQPKSLFSTSGLVASAQ